MFQLKDSSKVGVRAYQEIVYGSFNKRPLPNCMVVVTTAKVSKEVRRRGEEKGIFTWDIDVLEKMAKSVNLELKKCEQ